MEQPSIFLMITAKLADEADQAGLAAALHPFGVQDSPDLLETASASTLHST